MSANISSKTEKLLNIELGLAKKALRNLTSADVRKAAAENLSIIYKTNQLCTKYYATESGRGWKHIRRIFLSLVPRMDSWKFDFIPVTQRNGVSFYAIVAFPTNGYSSYIWRYGKEEFIKSRWKNVPEAFIDWYVHSETDCPRPYNIDILHNVLWELYGDKEGKYFRPNTPYGGFNRVVISKPAPITLSPDFEDPRGNFKINEGVVKLICESFIAHIVNKIMLENPIHEITIGLEETPDQVLLSNAMKYCELDIKSFISNGKIGDTHETGFLISEMPFRKVVIKTTIEEI